MRYSIETSKKFEKHLKRCIKRGLDMSKFRKCVSILAENGSLPPEYKPHVLKGKYAGIWECHIEFDWLLLWKQDDHKLTLLMVDTGTHSDVF